MKQYRKFELGNGLRVLLVHRASSLATTVLVLVEAGSEYETKRINGLSHFLEHMCFKGTTRRAQPGMISTELDSLGATSNAFTGQEYTGYWAKAANDKVEKVLDVVSDLYLNPIFNPAEIEKERGVIIEEINMYEDTPMRRVQELFTALLYGDQPAGWDIAGKKEIIRKLTREDFVAYRSKHYVAPATTVVVAGNFNEKRIESQVRSYFSSLPRRPRVKKPKTTERQVRPKTLLKFKESDQSHLVLGVRAFDMFDKRRFALQVLADVLGGGMSSRLFHRVREELGAAYYIRASDDLLLDHGYLAVSSGVELSKIEKVIGAILEEMDRLKRELVPEKELQKSKEHMLGGFLMGLETSDELASFYGMQELLTRKVKTPEEIIKKVRAVKAEEVRSIARTLFTNQKLNLSIIGPYKNRKPFEKILKFS